MTSDVMSELNLLQYHEYCTIFFCQRVVNTQTLYTDFAHS